MKRSLTDYLLLVFKGFGMGSADVVPGVSGGTIAFITGIYEELIDSIKSVDFSVIGTLRKEGIGAAWKQINGNFLVAVFGGILLSVFTLAKLLSYLLTEHPVLLWAFFMGLILASAVFVARQVGKWTALSGIGLLIGAGIALFISLSTQYQTPDAEWFLFVAGAIAICAMILPGISGSFILVIMGQYARVLEVVHERDIKSILIFGLGCGIGLLTFSRLVSWLFKKYRDLTIAVLTGFMVGSLPKVWPWKVAAPEDLKKGLGELVMPGEFAEQMGIPAQVLPAIGLAVLGLVVVFGLEKLAPASQSHETAD